MSRNQLLVGVRPVLPPSLPLAARRTGTGKTWTSRSSNPATAHRRSTARYIGQEKKFLSGILLRITMHWDSYNIEIHNNFDHHSHSTEAGDCPLDEKKLPVHPWVYNQDFPIPGNSPLYDAHVNIPIPADIDPGDYHFMIRVTDRSGWQQLKAVNIKISDNN